MYTLITAANSAQAYSLQKTLNDAHILLGDYMELPELLIKSGKVLQLPNPQNIAYAHLMLAFCLEKNITAIYPLRDIEQQNLLSAELLFNEYGIQLILPHDKI